MPTTQPEPWLRGTLTEFDPIRRQILHALEQAREDLEHWCAPLTDRQINARPFELAPVAFHLRHIARSLDRLLTYAEDRPLNEQQLIALRTELDPGAATQTAMAELRLGLKSAAERVQNVSLETFSEPRKVGQQALPTTVGSLLVHCAEHTQRHVGQAVTTAKIVAILM